MLKDVGDQAADEMADEVNEKGGGKVGLGLALAGAAAVAAVGGGAAYMVAKKKNGDKEMKEEGNESKTNKY